MLDVEQLYFERQMQAVKVCKEGAGPGGKEEAEKMVHCVDGSVGSLVQQHQTACQLKSFKDYEVKMARIEHEKHFARHSLVNGIPNERDDADPAKYYLEQAWFRSMGVSFCHQSLHFFLSKSDELGEVVRSNLEEDDVDQYLRKRSDTVGMFIMIFYSILMWFLQ